MRGSKPATKLGVRTVMSVLRELQGGAGDRRPLAVDGAGELVPLLARELRKGGEASAVVEGSIDRAAVLVWLGRPDEEILRRAARAKVPIVAVSDAPIVPYVLTSDIVRIPPGQGFPIKRIAAAVARSLGDAGPSLAARLPVLRGAVCDALIESCARRNAAVAAAVFVPGVDLPILTMNQIRLVLRIALAHGEQVDQSRAVEIAGVVGAGFGLRTIAREALDLIPVAGWALKGAIAYSGTKAIGLAAVKLFELRTPSA